LARANIAALHGVEAEAIVMNAAGCGAALKEYAELFDHDPAWRERAATFAARVRDVTEFLDALGLRRERLRPLQAIATYQDPCHLAHAQRIRAAPRRLLAAVPGLELREMERSDQCCGSAGIYNLQQPAIAGALLGDREQAIAATGANWIITANPGCMMQLARAAQPGQEVLHVIEVLDRSSAAGAPN
jgi:glycolate oxidase iron-sulfur subunit